MKGRTQPDPHQTQCLARSPPYTVEEVWGPWEGYGAPPVLAIATEDPGSWSPWPAQGPSGNPHQCQALQSLLLCGLTSPSLAWSSCLHLLVFSTSLSIYPLSFRSTPWFCCFLESSAHSQGAFTAPQCSSRSTNSTRAL